MRDLYSTACLLYLIKTAINVNADESRHSMSYESSLDVDFEFFVRHEGKRVKNSTNNEK